MNPNKQIIKSVSEHCAHTPVSSVTLKYLSHAIGAMRLLALSREACYRMIHCWELARV